ncbi:hypothetical protein ERJ75_000693900 [Trypanosoma vivax]|nr:hypothetical protein ERJ75_000693900 [Trypanosoma vivax]
MGGAGESTLGGSEGKTAPALALGDGTEREEWLGTMMGLGRQPAFGAGCGCCSRYASRGAAPPGKSVAGEGSVRGARGSVGGEIDGNARGEKASRCERSKSALATVKAVHATCASRECTDRAAEARKEAAKAAEFCADVEREARRLRDAQQKDSQYSTGTWPGK